MGKCLFGGPLHSVAWFVKAVATNSHSCGLFLSELLILTTYYVFSLRWQSEERHSVTAGAQLFLGRITRFPSLKVTL